MKESSELHFTRALIWGLILIIAFFSMSCSPATPENELSSSASPEETSQESSGQSADNVTPSHDEIPDEEDIRSSSTPTPDAVAGALDVTVPTQTRAPTNTPTPDEVAGVLDLTLPTATLPPPALDPANFTCRGAATTRLNVGFRAQVTFTDGSPNRIRDRPAGGTVLGEAPEGMGMTIIDGPVCSNELIWWKVDTDNGFTGWTAEGRPNDYWLEPIER